MMSNLADARSSSRVFRSIVGTVLAPPDAAGLSCSAVYTVKGCASVTSDSGAIDCSADAFDVLAGELRAHGAPLRFVRSARRAKKDEMQHARRARRLASSERVRRNRNARVPMRTLFEIALDNTREGCARETFGALLGWAQAKGAEDAGVRAFYSRIARDETRHASLSWRLHAWLLERLSEGERQTVEKALEDSLFAVSADHSPLDRALGVPDDAACRALAAALRRLARG